MRISRTFKLSVYSAVAVTVALLAFFVGYVFRASTTKPQQTPQYWQWVHPMHESNRDANIGAMLLHTMKQVFAEQGVPSVLVWLAEVESAFDPLARSPAGAVGMFQLMPDTAERFGLRVVGHDERTNPERSAFAAACYLRFLHQRFNDWSFAVAAYHAGERTVDEVIRGKARCRYADVADSLPSATVRYVEKVGAVIQAREGIQLSALPPVD